MGVEFSELVIVGVFCLLIVCWVSGVVVLWVGVCMRGGKGSGIEIIVCGCVWLRVRFM